MSALAAEIEALIRSEGPLPVDRFMALALGHPRHGYYTTRDPLGAAGDFVTAPEISQLFGELVGVWAAVAWEALGRPEHVNLVELGPGRGTLMADLLRAARALPAFRAALSVQLVETSPVLAARQQETLASAGVRLAWHRDLSSVPQGPAIVVANEFLDALPVRQFVMTAAGLARARGRLGRRPLAFGLARDPVPARGHSRRRSVEALGGGGDGDLPGLPLARGDSRRAGRAARRPLRRLRPRRGRPMARRCRR
jgi:NADH dehydrogenase [ubiquinone] 1 alpha subcomplex assembly factor 7